MTVEVGSRTRILHAASLLFVEKGLQSSMATIAASANVAMGSLYHHFPSKEGLILEVCRVVSTAMERDIVCRIDPAQPYEQRVTAYVRAYIDLIWSDAMRAALYDYLTNSPAIAHDELAAIFRAVTDHSIAIFTHPEDGGALSAQLTGSFIRGAIRNTLKRHRDTGEPLTQAQKDRITAMCRNALMAN